LDPQRNSLHLPVCLTAGIKFQNVLLPFETILSFEDYWGYIDVGDGYFRQNELMTTLRCCLPTNIHYLFTLVSGTNIQKTSPRSKFCHQHREIVTNFKSTTSRCHQRRDVTNITSKADLNSESFHWLKIAILNDPLEKNSR